MLKTLITVTRNRKTFPPYRPSNNLRLPTANQKRIHAHLSDNLHGKDSNLHNNSIDLLLENISHVRTDSFNISDVKGPVSVTSGRWPWKEGHRVQATLSGKEKCVNYV